MIDSILVPWDGSDGANAALATATSLAGKTGAGLTVLYVVYSLRDWKGPLEDPRIACSIARSDDFDACVRDTESFKDKIAALTKMDKGNLNLILEVGSPVEHIIRVAAELKSALIVMGSRGLSRWKGMFLGSVSSRVIHEAHCPVLVVNQKRRIDTILVAIDDTAASLKAVVWAGKLAKAVSAEVTVMAVDRVLPTLIPTLEQPRGFAVEVANLQIESMAEGALEAATRAAKDAGLSIQVRRDAGDVAERILTFAQEKEHDIIALGTHGRGHIESMLTGASGDRIIHMADRPVLVVR